MDYIATAQRWLDKALEQHLDAANQSIAIAQVNALLAIAERLDRIANETSNVAEMVHEGTYFDHPDEFN